jgi:dipeptidyl aminopeptidase/acylaminoacyl peptidase
VPRLLACLFALLLPGVAAAQEPKTVAEASGYTSTSRYADVTAFCDILAKRSPLVRVDTFGTSHEGRKLPLLVIADPPVSTAAKAKESGKLVVLAVANIHAGEVDGKEALLALARDLTAEKSHPLLKDLVILLVPILNADGNERIDPKNRPRENGPKDGAGIRENAQGLDLNRDFVKLETPEIRALVKMLNTWDPSVVIDCHTTNGSRHRWTLTYDGNRYPTSGSPLAEFVNRTMLPAAAERVKAATGFDTGPYGNFNADRTKWETYPASPRYGVQYVSIRGRVGILSESYSYAPFKDRVAVSKAFVKACFETAAARKADIRRLVVNPPAGPGTPVVTRTNTVADARKVTVPGFEEEDKDGKRVATDRPKDYQLDHLSRVEPAEKVDVPVGYLVPPQYTGAVETLRRHGVTVRELREDIELPVESYAVTGARARGPEYQGHAIIGVEANRAGVAGRMIPAGTILVGTAQPAGGLASYLLEPTSEDGLATWGFFTSGIVVGKEFPVLRLTANVPITTGALRPLPEDRVTGKPITSAPRFGFPGNPIGRTDWFDAEHFLQTKDGKLLKVHARTGRAEPFVDPAKLKKSVAAVVKDDPQAERVSRATNFNMDSSRSGTLIDIGADLVFAYFDGRPAVRVPKPGGGRQYQSFGPDGKRIAFVRGSNLFAINFDNPKVVQLTTDGGGEIVNGHGDWVYEEEIFNRNGRAYWWSPDGKQLAFMRFDDAPVKRFNLVDLRTPQGRLEAYPYPKPGDPNPLVKLGVVPAAGGKPVFLDFGAYKPEDVVISRVGWLSDSTGVFAYVQNRTQTWLDFVVWETPAAKPKALFRDKTEAWIEDPGPPHFLPDGSFLFLSERTGHKHIYRYAAGGQLRETVTAGDWDVKDVLRVDWDAKHVQFTGNPDGPTRLDLCSTDLDVPAGTGRDVWRVKGIGGEPYSIGYHQIALAPAGPLYVDRFTDPATPTVTLLRELLSRGDRPQTGPWVRVLDTNPEYEREEYKFSKIDRVQVAMKDGFKLEARVTFPPDFDPAKKYPVWVQTYAGPGMPTVRDTWGGGHVADQHFAAMGLIVFNVDPRSASGKGAKSAWACYKQLGVKELKDLEEAVAWLCKNPWADSSRVGISGHSYGGFMAAYALTHSKAFAAGIASGPVTDWRLYDTIYTERYMLTPKENPAGYDRGSVVKAAGNLHGKLLILHGMMDDNVHVQNSVQLADALQRAGKDFEMMFYPNARHGLGGGHYQRLRLDFIRRTMGLKDGG